jgi:hypothetical protein
MHTNRHRNRAFISVIENSANTPRFNIYTAKPYEEKGLQAVDFVSWSLLRKYEMRGSEFADILSDKIIREYEYY